MPGGSTTTAGLFVLDGIEPDEIIQIQDVRLATSRSSRWGQLVGTCALRLCDTVQASASHLRDERHRICQPDLQEQPVPRRVSRLVHGFSFDPITHRSARPRPGTRSRSGICHDPERTEGARGDRAPRTASRRWRSLARFCGSPARAPPERRTRSTSPTRRSRSRSRPTSGGPATRGTHIGKCFYEHDAAFRPDRPSALPGPLLRAPRSSTLNSPQQPILEVIP